MRVERAIFASGCAHSSCVCELLRDSQGRVSSLLLFASLSWEHAAAAARSIYYNLTKNTYTHSRMQRQREKSTACVCHKEQVWASVCFIFSLRTAAAILSRSRWQSQKRRWCERTLANVWHICMREHTQLELHQLHNTVSRISTVKLCGANFGRRSLLFSHWHILNARDEGGECTDATR